MIVAAMGYDVSALSYEEQCKSCEDQITALTTIWRQRITPRTKPQTGFHVWVLTSGLDAEAIAEGIQHTAHVVDAVCSTIETGLRSFYRDVIGPEKFMEIVWRLAPYNPDYLRGDTPEYADFYLLCRYEVE
jgi:hypothetical protein